MMEVYVLVEKKRNIILLILEIVLEVLAFLTGLLSFLGASVLIWAALLCAVLAYFLHTRKYEYEYSYFDGEVRFARITNKSSRKRLGVYQMEEVLQIAPISDRSMHQYLQNTSVSKKDYTSRKKDAIVYGMVIKHAEALQLIKFEPDEKYLDAMCIKYRQKVVR